MPRLKVQGTIAMLLAARLTLATAGAPVIGVAVKNGSFKVDGIRVDGNATVLEGNRIESGSGPARLQMSNGNLLKLDTDSVGDIYRNRMVLEKGSGELQTATPGYSGEALGLRITPVTPKSHTRLTLNAGRSLHVDALDGEVQVISKSGILLACMEPGASLEFTPPPDGAVAPSQMTGVVRKIGEKYVLYEDTSKLTIELRGLDVSNLLGQRVELDGIILQESSTVAGASQVVKVIRIQKLPSTSAVIRHPHMHGAVIGGVGVAAAAASAGVIVSQKSDTKTVSPSSR